MGGKRDSIGTLNEAIEELERFATSKGADFKEAFENLKETVSDEAVDAKKKVEAKVKENPIAALAIIAFVAFIIGWLLGHSKK